MHKKHFRALAAIALTLGLAAGAFGQQPVQFVALPTRVPDAVGRSNDLGHSDPDRVLHVAVSLPYGDPGGIAAFVDSVSDPTSPNYQHFLTPEQVGARFGLADNDVQSIVEHLKSAGLKINLVGKNHLSILAEGTVTQAEKAFNTTIHEFQALNADEPGNTRYFSYTTELTLPAAIAPYVIDITGLESFTKPQPRILTPTQTRTLYNLAPMYSAGTQGQGRTVGISNWDGYRLTNVPLYYSQYGLPTPSGGVGSNITVITISGGAGSGSPGGEGDLDIQMPLGMAPLCNLRIYDGGNSDLIGVLTSEANDNLCDTISESYGWNISTSTANSAHNLHLSMSAQGITYMAASGDSGTTLEPYSYPDYDPDVLMVGGTVATVNGSGVRTSEVAWSGSGGGWSTKSISFNVLPSWQHGTGVPTTINKRLVPDVALNASGSSGAYYFYYNGSLSSGSVGTSFASPVFAGSLAVTEQQIISQGGLPPDGAGKQRFGRIQDLFYSQNGRSDVWYDITSGSIGTLPDGTTATAGTAWDFCTGWGAINFNAFGATQVNDSCSGATVIRSGTYQGQTTWATNDGQSSCGNSNSTKDVWYRFDAAATDTLVVDTCGSSYNTVLSIHTGCPGTASNEVAGGCNDDSTYCGSGSQQSYLSVPVAAASSYYIRVSGYNGATGSYTLHVSGPDPDVTSPTPNPMTFNASPDGSPQGISTTSVTMTATTATDPSGGIQYYFTASGIGSHSSGWQSSTAYTDTGLQVNRNYSYKVKARDAALNETADSTSLAVATFIETPTGLTFGTIATDSIVVNALGTFTRLSSNLSGLYFDVTTLGGTPVGGSAVNTWTQLSLSQTAMATGLTPGTTYRFRVKARNYFGANETPWYPSSGYVTQPTTGSQACALLGDMNGDGVVNGLDIDGFLRAKLGGSPLVGENQSCANFGGTLEQDSAAFIAVLLGP